MAKDSVKKGHLNVLQLKSHWITFKIVHIFVALLKKPFLSYIMIITLLGSILVL